MTLKFPTKSWTTFFYGMCTEDRITAMIKESEADGCEFVQLLGGLIPAPRSAVAMPGTQAPPIAVLRLLVRMPDEAYDELVKKKGGQAPSLIH